MADQRINHISAAPRCAARAASSSETSSSVGGVQPYISSARVTVARQLCHAATVHLKLSTLRAGSRIFATFQLCHMAAALRRGRCTRSGCAFRRAARGSTLLHHCISTRCTPLSRIALVSHFCAACMRRARASVDDLVTRGANCAYDQTTVRHLLLASSLSMALRPPLVGARRTLRAARQAVRWLRSPPWLPHASASAWFASANSKSFPASAAPRIAPRIGDALPERRA